MKKTRRTSRVGENVRDALVEVFRHDLKDVDTGLSSITAVDVSPDLNFARVYISGLHEKETREVVNALQNARGAVRRCLGKRIRLRYTPELDFKYDEAPERGGRIEYILSQVLPQKTGDEAETEGNTPDDDDDHDKS